MRARATLFLTSGFPGIVAELEMDDAFFDSYRQTIFSQIASEPGPGLRQAVGAPTLVVELTRDDGTPEGTFTWRFHRVDFGGKVGDDRLALLPDWYEKALSLIASSMGPPPPEGWLKMLTAEEPVGFHRCADVPPDPPSLPQCPKAPADLTDGPFLDPPSNCYNYACNVPAAAGLSAIPGNPAGAVGAQSNRSDFIQACRVDGLRLIDPLSSICPGTDGHVVALINRPPGHRGFHFFRLNRDGTWSHKDGNETARNTDDREPHKHVITSLTQAEFAYPFEFIGYFLCPGNPTQVD